MLEYLRNASDKLVAKILMGLLIFSFVGWGVAEWIFSNATREAELVRVGSTIISVQQFGAERSRALTNMPKDQQKQIYTDTVAANEFHKKLLAEIAKETMVENRAADLGFIVTNKRIVREIQSSPEFQEKGVFSEQKFDTHLMNAGFSESDFVADLRGEILRSMVLGSMSESVPVPDFAVRAAYNARYTEREIEYSAVQFADFKTGSPSDDQLREFYAKNPHTVPEYRTVSYVLVSAKMDTPDTYDKGFVDAQKLEDAIISGESMSDAAAKMKAKYVSLPAFPLNKKPADSIMTDTMVSKVFAMDIELESEIIEIPQGFVIVRVDDVKPAHVAEFNSVKQGLVTGWQKEEQKKQAYVYANELLVDMNQGGALKGRKSAIVSRAAGAPIDVLAAVFAQPIGTNAIVPGKDIFYVVGVKKEIAPKIDTSKMASLRRELQNTMKRGVMEDYNSFLIRKYPVDVNTKTFERMFVK